MTSSFDEKNARVISCDRCVIVDNFVEIGDFSSFSEISTKNFFSFFRENLQGENFRNKTVLSWSIKKKPF